MTNEKTRQMKVEYVETISLREYEKNSRTHSESQVDLIVNSIKEFGFVNPIIIDYAGTVLSGHGRLAAAKKIGLDKVPVVRLNEDMTESEKSAYVIANNKIGLNSGWDIKSLSSQIEILKNNPIGMGITGFSEKDIARRLANINNPPVRTESIRPQPVDPDIWLHKYDVVCLVSERKVMLHIIKQCMLKNNLASTGAAFVMMCKSWREKNAPY